MNHEGQALQMAGEAMRNGGDWPLASLGIPVSRQSRRTDAVTQHPDDRSACFMLIIWVLESRTGSMRSACPQVKMQGGFV